MPVPQLSFIVSLPPPLALSASMPSTLRFFLSFLLSSCDLASSSLSIHALHLGSDSHSHIFLSSQSLVLASLIPRSASALPALPALPGTPPLFPEELWLFIGCVPSTSVFSLHLLCRTCILMSSPIPCLLLLPTARSEFPVQCPVCCCPQHAPHLPSSALSAAAAHSTLRISRPVPCLLLPTARSASPVQCPVCCCPQHAPHFPSSALSAAAHSTLRISRPVPCLLLPTARSAFPVQCPVCCCPRHAPHLPSSALSAAAHGMLRISRPVPCLLLPTARSASPVQCLCDAAEAHSHTHQGISA
ncbi:uncharacterized protein LOC118655707 [Myotis myotis]|uniref:uncharacterized protein LOC118655707 n=1 Tax=Myotis myotis TaxID=51298 RepID=UPI00174BFB1A|nr:uncharacterized protein LOC118655707 [Myotis myotis]